MYTYIYTYCNINLDYTELWPSSLHTRYILDWDRSYLQEFTNVKKGPFKNESGTQFKDNVKVRLQYIS